jgi:hypothetical protein
VLPVSSLPEATVQDIEAQFDLHHKLQGRRKRILAEISLTDLNLEATRSELESVESRLTSVRTRDLELLQELQRVTLDMWRIEWKLGRALDGAGQSSPNGARGASTPPQYDQDIVLYDYYGDFSPGTIGTFFALEGKEVGKDIMFAEKIDGRYIVIDREIDEERGRRVLTLHLARIR